MKTAKIFILSGPGGAGKTTLVNSLFAKASIRKKFIRSISFVTRQKRKHEQEGQDYFFVSRKEFVILKRQGFFLESEKVLKDYYGTPKYFYNLANKQKKHLILCIDVKGGMNLKKRTKSGKIVTIFINAPTQEDLYQRLKKRTETQALIAKRIKLAKKELQFARYYDYLVINQNLAKTVSKLEKILLKEIKIH